jgi:cytochrome c553
MKIAAIAGLIGAWLSIQFAIAGETVSTDDAPPTVANTCQTCHGLRGDSASGTVPRLNGQHAEYLSHRLSDFHDPASQDPHATDAMWGIVDQIDDQTLTEIAKYYARQPSTSAQSNDRLADEGRKLYMNGDKTGYVPACAVCHGEHGEGHDAVPRLSGQHATYLQNQLERLGLGLRESHAMYPKAINLSEQQIRGLVAYLANN